MDLTLHARLERATVHESHRPDVHHLLLLLLQLHFTVHEQPYFNPVVSAYALWHPVGRAALVRDFEACGVLSAKSLVQPLASAQSLKLAEQLASYVDQICDTYFTDCRLRVYEDRLPADEEGDEPRVRWRVKQVLPPVDGFDTEAAKRTVEEWAARRNREASARVHGLDGAAADAVTVSGLEPDFCPGERQPEFTGVTTTRDLSTGDQRSRNGRDWGDSVRPDLDEDREQHRFVVTVTADSFAEADAAMSRRLDHEEEYGFNYELDWSPYHEDDEAGGAVRAAVDAMDEAGVKLLARAHDLWQVYSLPKESPLETIPLDPSDEAAEAERTAREQL